MPEYSSTTITPADAVKVPAMNGSTSGNFQLDALRNFVLASKGQANGLASLGSDGKLTLSQLPDLADDVLVYGSYALLPNPGVEDKLYITADTNIMYRWDSGTSAYVVLTVDLSAYETKAEASELKSAIDSNTARIENLEQEHGSLVVTQYRGTNAVPSGKAKNAKVVNIVGKSRGWNQLVTMTSSTQSLGGLTVTFSSDGYFTISTGTGTFNEQYSFVTIPVVIGHKYLIGNCFAQRYNGSTWKANLKSNEEMESFIVVDTTGWDSGDVINCSCYIKVNQSYNSAFKYYSNVRDLTTILDDWNPSDITTANIPLMVKQIPDILKADAFGYSLVDTTVTGVVSNWFDGQTQSGYWASYDGVRYDNSNQLCSVNRIAVVGGKSYTIDNIGSNGGFRWYDSSDNYITGSNVDDVSTAVAPPNAKYLRFNLGTAYGSTYKKDIVVHPTGNSNVLSLPSAQTLRSAGSVSDELDVESGEIVRNCIEIDLTTLTQSGVLWVGTNNVAYPYGTNNVIMICSNPKYTSGNWNTIGSVNNEIAVSTSGMIALCLLDTSETPTGKIVIRKYEPATESIDPIPNNTIATEGGGTINTIQTQTPVIDNCLDVAYLAL